MRKFIDQNPSSLMKVIYEKQIISGPQEIFGRMNIEEFLKVGLFDIQPFIKHYYDEPDFKDYFSKFVIISREYIINNLRNKAR